MRKSSDVKPIPEKGKYAINSKEFRLAVGVVLATFIFQWTGFDIEYSLLDNLADIDWEKWDAAILATVFGIIRYFFTKGKIIGLIPFARNKLAASEE
ncbi:MAG: hypothetical protein NXI23_14545 [Bacteroidetes bacterium]|jgi:hypothetical protein|nr:hypothetical protein [Bacteroidota bacterium]MDF1863621.1 hypothetical protein [Saprospiraceae bacterium]